MKKKKKMARCLSLLLARVYTDSMLVCEKRCISNADLFLDQLFKFDEQEWNIFVLRTMINETRIENDEDANC